jgi:hypothetical protein
MLIQPRAARAAIFAMALPLAWVFCARISWGQAQPERIWRESENYGFRDFIHIVITTSKALHQVPGPEPGLTAGVGDGWLEFDRHGSLLSSSVDPEKGESLPKNVYEYDGQGRITMKAVWADDGVSVNRQEYKYGPFGVVEARYYVGGKLTSRTSVDYDSQGNFVHDAAYDAEGNLLNQSFKKQDKRLNSEEEEGVDGEGVSFVHVADRYDEKTGIVEHQSMDEKGHVVGILRLRDSEFLSWWRSRDFVCPPEQMEIGIFNWNDEAKRFQIYFNMRCPNTLEITRLHHAGKTGNIENDVEERTLEDGTVIDRVEYDYVRDAHDNWTKRVVLKWDARQGSMIPIREDQRTITYYDETPEKTNKQM